MTIQELLHELGTRMGTGPLTLDGQTPCTLCFDGKYVVTLYHDPDDHALLAAAPVGTVGAGFGHLREDDLRALLTDACLGARTGGAAFGLSPETGELLLWKRWNDEFPDYPALETALNGFLAQLDHWQTQRPGRADNTPRPATGMAPTATPEETPVTTPYTGNMLRI
ncbi:type III secretion system chaperone [Nitratidesulfovibrio termitidis]|uniref:type III secretion system chaperone n=1 Tax=Nitratidesulfovibrio termitidis TaxID=42252 RepID=UPI0003FB33D7|nr:type III secretion system chaperone [Nitratidesulfovibrio termitidis]